MYAKDPANPYPVPHQKDLHYGMLYSQLQLVGFYYRADIYFSWLGKPPCPVTTLSLFTC